MQWNMKTYSQKLELNVGIITLVLVALAIAFPHVTFSGGSSSSSSGSSSSGSSGSTSSTQSAYNSYVAQNACGCYTSATVQTAKSGGNVYSANSSNYTSSSGSVTGTYTVLPSSVTNLKASVSGGITLTYANGLVVSGVTSNYNTFVTTGYTMVGGRSVQVTISNQSGGLTGAQSDTWSYTNPSYNPVNMSSGGSSGGSSSGSGGSSGGTTQTVVGDRVINQTGGNGHWEEKRTCKSSGKKRRSCTTTRVWVADPTSQPAGPCQTASCSARETEALSGDSGGEGGVQDHDVWIDATPRLVRQGDSSTVEWGSRSSQSCVIRRSGTPISTDLAGRSEAENIVEQQIYTITCARAGGETKTDSVTINIIPVWREI